MHYTIDMPRTIIEDVNGLKKVVVKCQMEVLAVAQAIHGPHR